MLRYYFFTLFLIFSLDINAQSISDQKIISANFDLAERFTTQKMDKLIGTTAVRPRWIESTDDFWYTYETAQGKEWYYVHTESVGSDHYLIVSG